MLLVHLIVSSNIVCCEMCTFVEFINVRICIPPNYSFLCELAFD